MATNPRQNVLDLIDVISKVVGIGATVIGGYWVYDQFTVHRENAQIVDISLDPKLQGMDSATPILSANVTLKNIGKVPVLAGRKDNHEGLELTVIEYNDPKTGIGKKEQVIDWEQGGGAPSADKWPVVGYNMLKQYDAYKSGTYLINPGATFKESVAIPVEKNKLYLLRVRFFLGNGSSVSDLAYVLASNDANNEKAK